MTEKNVNRLLAGFVFLFSFLVYLSTMAPTVSFWDCGEFIACAYRMAVPHPPGAPFYLMVGRVFTLIPLFENIAARVNFVSVLSSAATVMLLYLIIVHFAKRMLGNREYTVFDRIGIYAGAVTGSLIFAFTHSFWFNAVESEVYAMSMLFTALVVYLVLVWEHHSEEEDSDRYLLLIAYLIGLAIGVHLLNVLALPFVFLIVYFKKRKVSLKTFGLFSLAAGALFLLIYPGVVYGIPYLVLKGGFITLPILVIIMIYMLQGFKKSVQSVALVIMGFLLILIGYSTYSMIYIRSNLDPVIDENDPETIERFVSYLNREQYGEHTLDRTKQWKNSPNGYKYKSASEFFWKYQVNKMFNRYLLWQFAGMDDDEYSVEIFRYFLLPLLLGLIGFAFQSSRNGKNAFAVFVLFFMTGYAIILYLNQPDPQPRERDYSYVGAFFAFAIWIGLGIPAILQMIKEALGERKQFAWLVAVLSFMVPVMMLAKDYHRQDRTGNYMAWDYSYNLLNSCEPNGILITNGDNDTFPLWYLQEVEGIRKDVRVVNLSLLNTPWYILQLKHQEPRVPITLSDQVIEQIEKLVYRKWDSKVITVKVPKDLQQQEYREKVNQMIYLVENVQSLPADTNGLIRFRLEPKIMNYSLRVQDYMFLHILQENNWQKPIYVSLTVSDDNQLDGLQDYRRVDGLTYRITTQRGWRMNPDLMYHNVMNVYQFRGLNDPSVYIPGEHRSLVSNYRNVVYQLNEYLLRSGQLEKSRALIEKFVSSVNLSYFPISSWQAEVWETLNITAAGVYSPDSLISLVERLKTRIEQGKTDAFSLHQAMMYNINMAYHYSPYFSGYYDLLLKKELESQSPDSSRVNEILRLYREYQTKRGITGEQLEQWEKELSARIPALENWLKN